VVARIGGEEFALLLPETGIAAAAITAERIRRAIAGFAAENGAAGQLLANIALAVSEAATNVVRHAYLPGRKGAIDYAADVEDGSLEIVIADDGEGIRPGPAEGSGLGLVIVSSVSADFAIRERRPRGTELWMSFLLDA
jgi:serine/threonine-protein kinase RsbW